MKAVMSLLALTFILISCASSAEKQTPEQKKAEIFYNHGTNMLVHQKYTDALKNLLEAYKLTPEDSKLCNNLGMAYYFKGQTATAISFIKKSITLDDKNSDAKNNLASIYFDQNKLEEALKLYQEVSRDLIYEHQYRVYGNIGLIYQKKGMNLAAIEHYKLAIKDSIDYCPAYYNLGQLSMQRYDYQGAISAFKDGVKGSCFKQPMTHLALAEAYTKAREYGHAETTLNNIVTHFPNSSWTEKAKQELLQLRPLLAASKQDNDVDIERAVMLYEQIKEQNSDRKETATPSF